MRWAPLLLAAAGCSAAAAAPQDWEFRAGSGFHDPQSGQAKSPEEALRHAVRLREEGSPERALLLLRLLLAHARDAAAREGALFEFGTCTYAAGRPQEAFRAFEAFVQQHPQSDRAVAAKRGMMASALQLATVGRTENVLGVLPILSSSRAGIELLKETLKKYPREDFSAEYYRLLGMYYYERAEFDAAQLEFSIIVGDADEHIQAQYPESPDAVLALYMLGRCWERRFDALDYDLRPLKRARRQYERFLEESDRLKRLPDPAKAWVEGYRGVVQERLASVLELMADKELRTAEYYDWKGRPASAEVSYRAIVKHYPKTRAAERARERLKQAPPAPPPPSESRK
jgi:outer membrane protein assembly factor BamD (BamD/ComL family)